jgi:hypothetical protein
VTTGPAYDTQRMEFVDMLTQLGQSNPAIAAGVPDLIVGSLDFSKAEEAAERLKLLLPTPIQQAMSQKDQSPAVMQLQGQLQQVQQAAEQHIQELTQHMQQLQAKANSRDDAMAREVNAAKDRELAWYEAETRRIAALQTNGIAAAKVDQAAAAELLSHMGDQMDRQHELHMQDRDHAQAAQTQALDQAHQADQAQFQADQATDQQEP